MPGGWALPEALQCILVLPHPASRHVRAAQPCQPRSRPALPPSAPSPALLCQLPGGGPAASPGEGTTARAAWRGLSRGAHRAWTGLSRDVGTLVDTHGAPLPAAPAGASTSGGNERVRTAARKTAREEPPAPVLSVRDLRGYSRSRPWPCSASGHRERDPPPRPCSRTGRKAGGGDTRGDDKENLGGDGENPANDG